MTRNGWNQKKTGICSNSENGVRFSSDSALAGTRYIGTALYIKCPYRTNVPAYQSAKVGWYWYTNVPKSCTSTSTRPVTFSGQGMQTVPRTRRSHCQALAHRKYPRMKWRRGQSVSVDLLRCSVSVEIEVLFLLGFVPFFDVLFDLIFSPAQERRRSFNVFAEGVFCFAL
jgi:hypothetical protein